MTKVVGALFFILGSIGFVFSLINFDLTILILTFITMLISYYLIREPKASEGNGERYIVKEKSTAFVPSPQVEKIINPTLKISSPGFNLSVTSDESSKNYFFNVAGIAAKNDEGMEIQEIIKEYVKEEMMYSDDKYDGLTNQEILEDGEDVYEADLYGFSGITLELEPTNPYDPNAIKVIHDELGHIGYVPRDRTSSIKSVLDKKIEIHWKLVGGKFKYVDDDEYKVRTKTNNYGMIINIYY